MSRGARGVAGAAILGLVVAGGRGGEPLLRHAEPVVHLVDFAPESGLRRPGEAARSALTIRNGEGRTIVAYVGYSVQQPDGTWADVSARRVELLPQATVPVAMDWIVPRAAASGAYRVVMAVWTAEPGSPDAQRLLTADRRAAFSVQADSTPLLDHPALAWHASEHRLGRGQMQPAAVLAVGQGFHLRTAAATCDGAEVRSRARYGFGTYAVRMRTPRAAGSLSAFFLYEGVGEHSAEIDIEIHNDGSRRLLMTSWIGGRETRQRTLVLPFDPAEATHEYAIAWKPEELRFLVDGRVVARWRSGFPKRPMHLMASLWWPTWLPCERGGADQVRTLEIERISVAPDR